MYLTGVSMTVMGVEIIEGDCRLVMAEMPESSIEAIVTDPPYELAFMGKKWDNTGVAFQQETWAECLRVLKPGGHLLAFGGTRTWHRLAVAIEDAGFEIRDSIAWMYGSGFPKSLDVAKSIENKLTTGSAAKNGFHALNGEKLSDGRIGLYDSVEAHGFRKKQPQQHGTRTLDATTDEALQWQGWGTALKPAFEPIVVARKPLIGTVAENVLAHGTGALNIDGCRVGTERVTINTFDNGAKPFGDAVGEPYSTRQSQGRWPANVILDESQAAELDRQSGITAAKSERVGRKGGYNDKDTMTGYGNGDDVGRWPDPSGGASRFFYVPKANRSERPRDGDTAHPTVKPLNLMRYLVKLVTPPDGTVLDPFAGSGTTAEACILDGYSTIGIELAPEYVPLIKQRIDRATELTENQLF